MKPTPRESAAVQRLAECLMECAIAFDEGSAIRWEARNRPATAQLERTIPPNRDPTDQPLLLNAREAAKYLSISTGSLRNKTAPRGPFPVVRIGSAVRYPLAGLKEAVNKMQSKPREESVP